MPDAAVDAGAIKVACDGALCATDNGGTCSAGSADPMWLVGALVAIAATRRRRQR